MDTKHEPENEQNLIYGAFPLNPISAHHRGVTGAEIGTLISIHFYS
jgi:hypothetical protein